MSPGSRVAMSVDALSPPVTICVTPVSSASPSATASARDRLCGLQPEGRGEAVGHAAADLCPQLQYPPGRRHDHGRPPHGRPARLVSTAHSHLVSWLGAACYQGFLTGQEPGDFL